MNPQRSVRLLIRLFGYPQVELEGKPVKFKRHKALALLAYLAVSVEGAAREQAATLLWPGYDQAQSGAYLRHALWELRETLGEAGVCAERETLRLGWEGERWIDIAHFQALLERGKTVSPGETGGRSALLEEVVALYRGDFLAGFSLRDSADFDEWQMLQSETLRRAWGAALVALAETYTAQGEYELAIAHLKRWLAVDPLDEAQHAALIRLYAWAGQRSAALRQYESCAALLRRELGTLPDPATTALYEQIRKGALRRRDPEPLFVAMPPAVPAPPPSPGPLVSPTTPFVGRETELAELAQRLADPTCRLLTLTGPGGIGKTRLALQAANTQAGQFPQGVVLVPLASLSAEAGWDTSATEARVATAIAEALHLPFHRENELQRFDTTERTQLFDYLRSQRLLLVLDNMEHLTAAAGLCTDLLAVAPNLKLLATSRERLNLREEWVIELAGLPCQDDLSNAPEPAENGAAQLFIQCARRANARFSPQAEDRDAIARICRLVGGVPLALELAATWVRLLSCTEIADEIARNLDFLVSTQHDLPERHRSLRATFESSWALLSEAERSALSRLSCFPAGCTRAAAAQVARASLGMLSSLADKSLVRRNAAGRYELHQVLKQYAAEELARQPAAQAETLRQYAAYYLDWLEERGAALFGSEQQTALDSLAEEAENLHLAWQLALEAGDWERIQRALPLWVLFFEMRGRFTEGRAACRALVAALRPAYARQPSLSQIGAPLALALAGIHYFALDQPQESERALSEAVTLALSLPDGLGKAFALLLSSSGAGRALGAEHRLVEPQERAAEALALFRRLGHPWGMATAQLVWADAVNFGLGQLDLAETAYREALVIFEQLDSLWGRGVCLNGLAGVASQRGQYAEAARLQRASLAIAQALGNLWRTYLTRTDLARNVTALGDYAAARAYYRENLVELQELGNLHAMAENWVHLAELAALEGDRATAQACYRQGIAACRQGGYLGAVASLTEKLESL